MGVHIEEKIKQIALFGTFEDSPKREMLIGIMEYFNQQKDVLLWKSERFNWYDETQSNRVWKKLLAAKPNGIISLIGKQPQTSPHLNIPFVDIGGCDFPETDLKHKVKIDNSAIGKMAAEYLIDLGFENFAYCGYSDTIWSTQRYEAFKKIIEKNNFNVILKDHSRKLSQKSAGRVIMSLVDWLIHLPTPVAIMTCEDHLSTLLLKACKLASKIIPDEVGILGVDDDLLTCQNNNPNLSSIRLNYEKVGYEAAAILKKMINKEKFNNNIVLEPVYVVPRESTDVLAIKDHDILEAIKFIRKNSYEPIQVLDVVANIGVSRSKLEREFLKVRKHSIFEEIKLSRINVIKKMLLESDMQLCQISKKLGFICTNSLSCYFKRITGITPSEFIKLYGHDS